MRNLVLVLALGACGSSGDLDTWSGHARQIAVAGNAACALEDDGRVACWGTSSVLQRDGILVGGATPTCIEPFVPSNAIGVFCSNPFGMHVDTELRFVELSAAWDDTFCGRTEEGAVHCWPGRSFDGGTPPTSVELSGSMVFTSISGTTNGYLGITADGLGIRAQMGVPSVNVEADQRYRQLRGGDNSWVGIETSGTIRQGDFNNSNPPEQIAPIVGATNIAAGGTLYVRNGCAINDESKIWCWGPGLWGELGDGTFTARPDPAPILGDSTYTDVATSGVHVCAVTTAGDIECWGWNSRGQSGATAQSCPDPADLGIEWPCSDHPVRIPLPLPATSVRVGPALSCAILADRTVWCWGMNLAGQLGRGSVGAESATAEQVQ